MNNELLLKENPNRFVLFPIEHQDLWKLYREAQDAYWTAEEVNLEDDLKDWKKLSEKEQYFISHILAFFAASDGIVNENLAENMVREVQYTEAKFYYGFQIMMENIHSTAYLLMIDTYVKDDEVKMKLFNAVETFPALSKKAEWALKWIGVNDYDSNFVSFIKQFISLSKKASPVIGRGMINLLKMFGYDDLKERSSFAERLVAFAAVEGIFFSGSFCSIFWLKNRGLMEGLCKYNELISRDEASHCRYAVHLYNHHITNKLPKERVSEIILSALDIEKEFITEALPVSLIGMNNDLMSQYLEYVTDNLLNQFGCDRVYNVENPFPFMANISLEGKTNFFEGNVTEYKMVKGSKNQIKFDANF